ncbi:MAG: hypothetical protein EAZ37_02285 [Burkholderiales bacterium]|nr:MAG: hypothetical protein EAZ37_02285 [Burkholderiales bacterium]
MNTLYRFSLVCFLAFATQSVMAQANLDFSKAADGTPLKMSLMLSPYTYHYNPKPTHRPVVLVGIEREYPNQKLDGAAVFTNSFGQPSIVVYPWGGVYKNIWGVDKLSFKWIAGVLVGYRGEFKDQVPNIGGIAPAVIFALGYEFQPGWTAQVNAVGTAAAQFQLNVKLD